MAEWIEHTGNECPVDKDAAVEVKLANSCKTCGFASDFDWQVVDGCDGSITHYRLSCGKREDQPAKTAVGYLRKGAQHIEDRASQRDCLDGERSMAKTVEAFNTIYGHSLSETDGWQFMSILKKVRAVQGGYHEDDYEDDIGYAALAAECAAMTQAGIEK